MLWYTVTADPAPHSVQSVVDKRLTALHLQPCAVLDLQQMAQSKAINPLSGNHVCIVMAVSGS